MWKFHDFPADVGMRGAKRLGDCPRRSCCCRNAALNAPMLKWMLYVLKCRMVWIFYEICLFLCPTYYLMHINEYRWMGMFVCPFHPIFMPDFLMPICFKKLQIPRIRIRQQNTVHHFKTMLLRFSLHVLRFYCHFRSCTLFRVDQSSSTSGWLWGHHQLFPFWKVLLALLWLGEEDVPFFSGRFVAVVPYGHAFPFPQNSWTNVRGTNVL